MRFRANPVIWRAGTGIHLTVALIALLGVTVSEKYVPNPFCSEINESFEIVSQLLLQSTCSTEHKAPVSTKLPCTCSHKGDLATKMIYI